MLAFWWLGMAAMLSAQQPGVHYWHQGIMPPGAIGSRQLQRGGPLPGFLQPVEIKAPGGTLVSLAVNNQFGEPRACPRKAGLLIGAVYRLRVTNIRLAEGAEVFPTIEVIDRLYTPVGQERRFAIPIEIAEDDLKLALAGKFVTRVIYLENPRDALPALESLPTRDNPQTNWYEAAPGQDPLAVADGLGRPVAILRMGGRLPDAGDNAAFFFGSPPLAEYPPEAKNIAAPETKRPVAPALNPPRAVEEPAAEIQNPPKAVEEPAAATPKVKILPPPPTLTPDGQSIFSSASRVTGQP